MSSAAYLSGRFAGSRPTYLLLLPTIGGSSMETAVLRQRWGRDGLANASTRSRLHDHEELIQTHLELEEPDHDGGLQKVFFFVTFQSVVLDG
jgi:hypothetical protein